MTSISTIQSRVRAAVGQLVEADRRRPRAPPEPQGQATPAPSGAPVGPPAVPGQPAASAQPLTVASHFAATLYEAAGLEVGASLQASSGSSWTETLLAPYEQPTGDLRLFAAHVNAIVGSLLTDAKGDVTPAALEALPATIEAYFAAQASGGDHQVPRATIDHMVSLVREAAAGGTEWA
jgi:hypothetical protein